MVVTCYAHRSSTRAETPRRGEAAGESEFRLAPERLLVYRDGKKGRVGWKDVLANDLDVVLWKV
jgi:hypothetical protein